MQNPAAVLVLINQTIKRKGLSHLLNSMPSISVIGEAAEAEEGLRMARASKPHVILIDQERFESIGPEFIRCIWQNNPHTSIVVLADYSQDEKVKIENQSGSLQVVSQNTSPENLSQIIYQISNNGNNKAVKPLPHPIG